jgi:membrane-bound lytic murein transglycosylase B
MRWPSFIFATMLILLSFSATVARADNPLSFDQWLANFKAQAAQAGIPAPVIADAFMGVEADDAVIELDQKQPEAKVSFTKYLSNTITPRRIKIGRAMMHEYHDTLHTISARYHVQPQYIVALWGIESDFGRNKGDFSVVQSLATLAYEGRRADFFSGELMAALNILATEHMQSSDLIGSWAGAMGDCQFMPSTYLKFAADGNGDGKRDIWNAPPDVFASIANYLHSLGWNAHEGWGDAVVVPDDFKAEEADLKHAQTATYWRKRGLQYGADLQGRPQVLLDSDKNLYAMYPGTEEEGAFLVTENYQSLLACWRMR